LYNTTRQYRFKNLITAGFLNKQYQSGNDEPVLGNRSAMTRFPRKPKKKISFSVISTARCFYDGMVLVAPGNPCMMIAV
jgi:hypothetical protein